MFIQAKSSISRLLRQSILELCKASVPQGQGLEIDGIVCLSLGDDNQQIVVKVHERLGQFCTVSDATSSQQFVEQEERVKDTRVPRPPDRQSGTQPVDILSGYGQPIEVVPTSDIDGLGEEPAQSGDQQGIRRIAATPIWRQQKAMSSAGLRGLLRQENRRAPSSPSKLHTSPNHTHRQDTEPQGSSINGTAIKTEIESDGEDQEVSSRAVASSQPVGSGFYQSEAAGEDHMARQADILCEHCQMVCASFRDLKEHNDSAHGAYTCSYCWRSYLHYTNYALHLKRHRATPSRRSVPTEHCIRSSPIVPVSIRSGHKNDKAKCGLCGEGTRTHATMIQHLKSTHEFEHCFTCPTCLEYFPNRWTFVIHRRMVHGDINQCRCERCDVFFTYVEFKVHERECVASPMEEPDVNHHRETERSQSQIVNQAEEMETNDSVNSSENRTPNSKSYINQLLASDEALRDQVRALTYVNKPEKTKPALETETEDQPDDHDMENGDQKSPPREDSGKNDDSSAANSSNDKAQNDIDLKEDPYEDPMAYGYYPLPGAISRSPEESENSLESSKDLSQSSDTFLDPGLHSPSPSMGGGALHRNPIKSMDSLGAACPGPFRCQNCFQVSEQFEEYEMHCYEMHNRFVCPFCAQSFANKRNLHRHIRKHTGEMPYTCVECGEKFYRDDDLRRHKLSKHSQDGGPNVESASGVSVVSNSTGV